MVRVFLGPCPRIPVTTKVYQAFKDINPSLDVLLQDGSSLVHESIEENLALNISYMDSWN
jgi:hypothetical protein